MAYVWEAQALTALPVSPAVLAEAVAAELCDPGRLFTEMILECLATIDASLSLGVPELLADHFAWQVGRLAIVAPDVSRAEVVHAICTAMRVHLDPRGFTAVDRHMGAAVEAAEALVSSSPAEEQVLSAKARGYLDHVLRGERDAAVDLVMDEVARGVDAQDILLDVLQPVQVEIGRLWEEGRASVAHEHLCTAVTQMCMTLLHPQLRGEFSGDRTVVAASVGTEAHEVGIRIVADLLKRDGWRTFFLGVGVPAKDVVALTLEQQADVVALSATMPSHLPEVRELVRALRADPGCAEVKVVVGGRPFLVAPRLASLLGADGVATDAAGAVRLCNKLTGRVRGVAVAGAS